MRRVHHRPVRALRPDGQRAPPTAQWHFRHIEFFHDHIRIERMFFDGRPDLIDGCLNVDRSRPGLGLELKRADAEPYQVA